MQQDVFNQVKKSYYFVSAGVVTYAEAFSPYAYLHGRDSSGREIAEGWYASCCCRHTPRLPGADTWTLISYL